MPNATPPIHCRSIHTPRFPMSSCSCMHTALHNSFNHIHATLLLYLFIYPFGIYTYFVRVYVCDVTGLNTYSFVFLLLLTLDNGGADLRDTRDPPTLSLFRSFLRQKIHRHITRVHACSRSKAPHLSSYPSPLSQETK
jgi:hypothetical protein